MPGAGGAALSASSPAPSTESGGRARCLGFKVWGLVVSTFGRGRPARLTLVAFRPRPRWETSAARTCA
eukprot:3451049-Alexandrium_andersonii.AAC.1